MKSDQPNYNKHALAPQPQQLRMSSSTGKNYEGGRILKPFCIYKQDEIPILISPHEDLEN